jgi:hypothetical protein
LISHYDNCCVLDYILQGNGVSIERCGEGHEGQTEPQWSEGVTMMGVRRPTERWSRVAVAHWHASKAVVYNIDLVYPPDCVLKEWSSWLRPVETL